MKKTGWISLFIVLLSGISCNKAAKNYLVGEWSVTIPESNSDKTGEEFATGMGLGILIGTSGGAQAELEFFENGKWGFIFINNGEKSGRIAGTYELNKNRLTLISTEDASYSTFYLVPGEEGKKITLYTENSKDNPAFILDKHKN